MNKIISTLKTVYSLILCLLLFNCAPYSKSIAKNYPSTLRLNSDILPGPDICVLKSFQGTSTNNKFYVSWIVLNSSNQCIFQLEYSSDGKTFRPYYLKKGSISPNNSPLLYCVVDSLIHNDIAFFKLKAIPENALNIKIEDKRYSSLFEASIIKVVRNTKSNNYNLLQAY